MDRYEIERKDGQFVVRITNESGRVLWSQPFQSEREAKAWMLKQTIGLP